MRKWVMLALLLLFTGCMPAPIHAAPDSIEVLISDGSFQPDRWRVVAGTELTLTITNADDQMRDWVLLSWPIEGEFDPTEESNVLFRLEIPAGETVTTEFSAPLAPGQYDVLCSLAGCYEEGYWGRLVVYQSNEYLP